MCTLREAALSKARSQESRKDLLGGQKTFGQWRVAAQEDRRAWAEE